MPTLSGPEYLNGQFSVAADGTVSLTTPPVPISGGSMTGPLVVNPYIVIGNAVTSPPAHALAINAATASPSVPAFPVSIWSASENAAGNIALLENYNATAGAVPYLIGRYARGTAAAPAAVQALDGLMSIQGAGRNSAGGWNNAAALVFGSLENFTGTAGGGRAYVQTAAVGTTMQTTRLTVAQGVVIGNGAADPGQGGLTINAGPNPPQAVPVPAQLLISNEGAPPTLVGIDQYGTSNPAIYGRRARGSAASPTAVQTGDVLFAVSAQGWGATSFNGAAATAALIFAATENYTDAARGSSIRFATTPNGTASNAEAMRIDNTGNVGIGTAAPGARLDVYGSAIAQTPIRVGYPGTTVFGRWYVDQNGTGLFTTAAQTGHGLFLNELLTQCTLRISGTERLTVDGSGGLTITGSNAIKPGGGSWAAPSSREFKSGVAPYPRGLLDVLALNPVAYNYNGKGGLPTGRRYAGLIAEEVEPVMPEIVGEMSIRTSSPHAEEHDYLAVQTIDPSDLVFALINAVKELNDQGKEMRAKIAALESATVH